MQVKGYLITKKGKYYTDIRIPNVDGGTTRKWLSTKISVEGKTKRETDSNRRKAEKILYERIREYEEGSTVNSEKLFTNWIEDWLEREKTEVRLNTWESYECSYKVHIEPYFKQKKLKSLTISDVTPMHIQKYIDYKYKKGQSANSIKHHMRVLNGTFKQALRFNVIPFNPCERVSLPKMEKHIGKAYTPEQAMELLKVIRDDPLEPAIMLGLFLGLRRSECLGLRWEDVDFDNNIVKIRNTVIRSPHHIVEQEKTKSKASKRDLPLMPSLRAYLLELRVHQENMQDLMGDAYFANDHVCRWDDGRPFAPDYPTHHFPKILKKHNLPKITFHELRHTAGSLLINAGEDVKRVQEYLGHEDVSTTLDIYTHLTAETKRRVGDTMDTILGGKNPKE